MPSQATQEDDATIASDRAVIAPSCDAASSASDNDSCETKNCEEELPVLGPPLPLLPGGVWSRILDNFSTTSEVDRIVLSLQSTAVLPNDAVNTTVKYFGARKPSCLRVAQRFVGVAHLLVEIVEFRKYNTVLKQDKIDMSMALVSRFSPLRKLTLGVDPAMQKTSNMHRDEDVYTSISCKRPKNHKEIFNTLVLRIADEFSNEELNANVILHLFRKMNSCGGSRETGCSLCRKVCETFPFEFLTRNETKLCYSYRKRIEFISERSGGRDYLSTKELYVRALRRVVDRHEAHSGGWEAPDGSDYEPPIWYSRFVDYSRRDIALLGALKNEYGCKVETLISRDEVLEILDLAEWDCPVVLRQSICETLISYGVPLLQPSARNLDVNDVSDLLHGHTSIATEIYKVDDELYHRAVQGNLTRDLAYRGDDDSSVGQPYGYDSDDSALGFEPLYED